MHMIVRVKSNLDSELKQLQALGPGVRYEVTAVESRLYRLNGERGEALFDPDLFENEVKDSRRIVQVKTNLDWELAKLRELGRGNCYTVLAIESAHLRIHGGGGPCLYPPLLFTFEDGTLPQAWVTQGNPWRDGAAGWPELIAPGFMERWHDGDADAITVYQRVLKGVQLGPIRVDAN